MKIELTCFSHNSAMINDDVKKDLKCSNKILLPTSVLFDITSENESEDIDKMYFKISNIETMFGVVCAVHEFSAPQSIVHLPFYIMEECGMYDGDKVNVELVKPTKGTYMKLKLHNGKEFSKIEDPKEMLEKYLSKNYPIVTQGHTIKIKYKDNKTFYIDIVETKPEEIIEIFNVDVNVDFDKPYDYEQIEKERLEKIKQAEEEKKKQELEKRRIRNEKIKKLKNSRTGFVPFSGKGYTLGKK